MTRKEALKQLVEIRNMSFNIRNHLIKYATVSNYRGLCYLLIKEMSYDGGFYQLLKQEERMELLEYAKIVLGSYSKRVNSPHREEWSGLVAMIENTLPTPKEEQPKERKEDHPASQGNCLTHIKTNLMTIVKYKNGMIDVVDNFSSILADEPENVERIIIVDSCREFEIVKETLYTIKQIK